MTEEKNHDKSNQLLSVDVLIDSLGAPSTDNEYIIRPDKNGVWWMEHRHIGSGEPLEQWLTGKP